ncbi:sensor histidine kinase [Nocardioides sp.]|uniref:sensor histidine kinase n=1 Tax=Nocardioides sp. TaxID=35761 RepID=UPI0039E38D2A
MRAPLTIRLVVTAVALVLVVSALIALVTTLAMRSFLTDRLDEDVQRSARSLQVQGGPGGPGNPPDKAPTEQSSSMICFGGRSQPPGTLNASLDGETSEGCILGDTPNDTEMVGEEVLTALVDVPDDQQVYPVDLLGLGTYHVTKVEDGSGGSLVTGLPVTDVTETVNSLIRWEVVLVLLGALAASGAGFVVVRRQLRPLRKVAATAHTVAGLPLDSGDVGVTQRVPASLTDERTEVGQVGAALNTLLAHVESSLASRHRSEQQVRQFVADASHELRTPLTTIRGYTELARRRPETVPTALAKVEEESGRMTGLVEDLLLLARLDSGRPLSQGEVDLTRLLLEAVSDARVVAPSHHWVFSAPEQPVEVTGDEQRLHQVITNLLTNARVYTPAGTTVTVTVLDHGFAVHDDGPGFPADLVDHAFERFVRGDESRAHTGTDGGAGLGLSLVQAIVASHGGTVSLASRPGDTTITVTLPA